ncbi:MAG: hypothetical protein OEX83_05315, partial [Gammaproteobacteria bacterium]|nr:hypothetical protein [Gammaproteobacteria bacterium]
MILVICEIKPCHKTTSPFAKVWVDTDEFTEAKFRALENLALKGIEVLSVTEAVVTDKSDYFPPCTSLDTFALAE